MRYTVCVGLVVALVAVPLLASAGPGGERRPDGFSVGLGVGVNVDNGSASDILAPDAASARVRLGRVFTIEPFVDLSVDSTKTDNGVADDTTTATDVRLGALLRVLAITRGHMDFVILGTAGIGYTKTRFEPNAGMDRTDASTSMGLGWGVGVEWWFRRNWALSFNTTNPALTYTKTTSDIGGLQTSTRTTSIGAIFQPDVNVMVHLFF